ncbi:glycosyl hydrolase family protein [Butyrivibrio sp. CB08]|uniref:carbohydrate binding domain-containing protein n=1 Tax=Butyrivibrio sp. CB08 TaxID=2364879 RepID=UPI000EAAC308|nr:carbohydrate binding domain-containing protein [Butyrivibrio sp. CB08]RKM59213.1 glycosyl hydrolase family protein [Butyrivibrio sp. CB08]
MKNRAFKKVAAMTMSVILVCGFVTGCGSTGSETVSEPATEEQAQEPAADQSTDAAPATDASSEADGYTLVWEDEFDGNELNTSDWNVETHEPGWVNAELQRYTAIDEGNIEVSDGTLKIKPHIEKITTDDGEKEEITSGRITTQNKHDFTYGRFEARAKVPTGKGYLPAFWLMATDEGLYGQWPKCGEVDIMEIMGQDTSKSYHTIHYGYSSGDGHRENQGIKTVEPNGFSDDFHLFRVDWEPGKLTWFVDDEEIYTTSDWFTGTDDDNQITYPAPFDQDFYIILNLAVGGNWVGYPSDAEKEQMNDKVFEVDYVKVYQKDTEVYKAAEDVAERPVEDVTFREPDAEGNFVNNPTFTEEIGLDRSEKADPNNWKFHFESDAFGSTYELSDEGITLLPKTAGSVFYAVQLKQENIPMYKGWEYEISFDAYSTEEREITVDVEGPDRGWIRYFEDTPVTIGPEKKTYTLTFTMNEKTDANGSLEFNLGHMGTLAPVTINNVKLTHISGEEITTETKTIRPDGNYIYNGSFDQGDKRLGYWEIEDPENVSVTNDHNVRELKVVVPEDSCEVVVEQKGLSPIAKGDYEFSFSARQEGGATDGVTFTVAGKEITPALESSSKEYTEKLTFDSDVAEEASNFEIHFTKKGTYYVDNTFLGESALIKNGSFNAGLSGFTPYVYDSVTANYVIDSMNGNENAFAITIDDTMATDEGNAWYVQLNQDGVTLTEGKTYKLTFKAKSTIDRKIAYSLQEYEGEWTNYSHTEEPVAIGKDWKTISTEFKMEYPTDTNARFNITLGSVGGDRITDKHDVFIDDITLEEIN